MARDLKEFKEFLRATNYRCAKKNGQPILVRDTSDPDVVFISAEEYLALEAKASKAAPKEKDDSTKATSGDVDVDALSFQELKRYAKEHDISFTNKVTKAKLLEKIKKTL